MTGTEIEKVERKGLLATFGERYSIEPAKVKAVLAKTAFPDAKSDEEFIAMLTVANEYGLNPFTREIYAFSKDGRVQPVVGIDGWIKVINQHPDFAGMTIEWAEKRVKMGQSKECPEYVRITIHHKSRELPTVVDEWLDECYKNTLPWNTSTKRMLRHRGIIQAGRVAFGLSFYSPDDEQAIKAGTVEVIDGEVVEHQPDSNADRVLAALNPPKAEEPSETVTVTDEATGESHEVDAQSGEVIEAEDDLDIALTSLDSTIAGTPPDEAGEVQAAAAPAPAPAVDATPRQKLAVARYEASVGSEQYGAVLRAIGVHMVDQMSKTQASEALRRLDAIVSGQGKLA